MVKYFLIVFVFVFGSSAFGQFAQPNPTVNTPEFTEQQNNDILGQELDNMELPDIPEEESIEGDDDIIIPGTAQCIEIFEPEEAQECVSCMNDCMIDGGVSERCGCKCLGGISLNTNVPFIGSCIFMNTSPSTGASNSTTVNQTTAFPLLIGGLSRILVTAILVFSFVMIIVGGVMMTMGGADAQHYETGKKYITHVVVALALLGSSGLILRLINPNFFG